MTGDEWAGKDTREAPGGHTVRREQTGDASLEDRHMDDDSSPAADRSRQVVVNIWLIPMKCKLKALASVVSGNLMEEIVSGWVRRVSYGDERDKVRLREEIVGAHSLSRVGRTVDQPSVSSSGLSEGSSVISADSSVEVAVPSSSDLLACWRASIFLRSFSSFFFFLARSLWRFANE